MTGWAKVIGFCAQAAKDGWAYAVRFEVRCDDFYRITDLMKWIDTCRIDKTSSAELTEAINSIFAWYKHAEVCYAYLSDVFRGDGPTSDWGSSFQRSVWFSRGW
jgi:hypothetical protein